MKNRCSNLLSTVAYYYEMCQCVGNQKLNGQLDISDPAIFTKFHKTSQNGMGELEMCSDPS